MELKDKIGQKVRMKTGAVGTIVGIDSHIRVDFDGATKEFQLDAFDKGYLVFLDESLQSGVDEANEAARIAAEKAEAERLERERIGLEERKKRWAEEAAKKAAQKQKRHARMNSGKKSGKPHPYIDARRAAGKKCFFMVCQNQNYGIESDGGYIWAPKQEPDHMDHASWAELDLVKEGDIIFHHFDNTIFAVSVAKSDRVFQAPSDGRREGRLVPLSYHFLSCPASTEPLRMQKASLGQIKYAPFDKNGKNKQGFYLSELPDDLALAFIDVAIAANPGDADLLEYKKEI